MKKSIAIQMDNIEKIDYEFDTSFLIGYEAQERNYEIFYYNPKDLFIKENKSDLVVMLTHKRKFPAVIWDRSLTKKFSYQPETPLLVIHS